MFHKIVIFYPSPRITDGVSCLLSARTGGFAVILNFSCPRVLISVAFDPSVSVVMVAGILKMTGISSALPVCPHRQSCFQCS